MLNLINYNWKERNRKLFYLLRNSFSKIKNATNWYSLTAFQSHLSPSTEKHKLRSQTRSEILKNSRICILKQITEELAPKLLETDYIPARLTKSLVKTENQKSDQGKSSTSKSTQFSLYAALSVHNYPLSIKSVPLANATMFS